jgi:hypothetical protein
VQVARSAYHEAMSFFDDDQQNATWAQIAHYDPGYRPL